MSDELWEGDNAWMVDASVVERRSLQELASAHDAISKHYEDAYRAIINLGVGEDRKLPPLGRAMDRLQALTARLVAEPGPGQPPPLLALITKAEAQVLVDRVDDADEVEIFSTFFVFFSMDLVVTLDLALRGPRAAGTMLQGWEGLTLGDFMMWMSEQGVAVAPSRKTKELVEAVTHYADREDPGGVLAGLLHARFDWVLDIYRSLDQAAQVIDMEATRRDLH